MPLRRDLIFSRLFLEIVCSIAIAEFAVMIFLPMIAPGITGIPEAILDALILSALSGTFILWRTQIAAMKAEKISTVQGAKTFRHLFAICFGILIFGCLLTFLGTHAARNYYYDVTRLRFESMAEKMIHEVDSRMRQPIYGLKGARGVYAASKSVERLEFRAYANSRNLPEEFPGVLGFGYIQKVPRKDLQAFIRAERADDAPDFNVRTSGDAPDLYIIKFIDPLKPNLPAWGYDVGSEPVRRRAVERAAATGMPTLTARITLVQSDKEHAGFLWLIPIYQKGADLSTPESRKASLQGFVYSPVLLEFAIGSLTQDLDDMLDIAIFQGTEINDSNLLLDSHTDPANAPDKTPEQTHNERMFHLVRQIEIGGQTWTCVVTSTPKFESTLEQTVPLLIAICGLLLTMLFVFLFWLFGTSRIRAIELAEHMTRSLRASEAEARRLAMVASHTDNSVVITDADERIVWINNGFTQITGYTLDQVQGERPGPLLKGPDTDPATVAKMKQGILSGKGFNVEIVNYTRAGTPFWSALEVQPLHDESGKLTGFMGIGSDITERRRTQQELLEAKLAAESANRAKSEFLAMMSHEIRTPMNGVIGMTTLMMDTPLNLQQREYVEIIRSSGETLLTLINDILDFSKIESGRLELEDKAFNIRDCVEGSLDLLAATAAHKGIDLLYEITEGVPSEVEGDVTRLRQILLNLIGNALKFTKDGEVVVTIQPGGHNNGSSEILFSVRDTGIGIAPEARDRLFRPFTQVDASTTRKYGGTGLGLAISRRLAELMGGTMWLESDPGVGTTFFFTIRARTVSSGPKLFISSIPHQLKGKRLLVVDDNATNRRILTSLGEKWGLEVVSSATGEEALEVIKKSSSFDFAILDMQMPGMDGTMLAQEIKKRPETANLPLILLSSMGLPAAKQDRGLFVTVLTKPEKPSQIFDALVHITGPERISESTPEQKAPDTSNPAFSHVKILLAEDNSVNQKVAKLLLSNVGYKADIVGNGLEVLDALERQPYDIILMDVQMPEMDGLEATRHIRKVSFPHGKRPWIIALTANAMEEDRKRCLDAGMDDYLSKPLKKELLVEALTQATSGRPS